MTRRDPLESCALSGACVRSSGAPVIATDLARPKSSTLTTCVGVILTFDGFRSRWMTPRRVQLRAPRRSADAISQGLGDGERPAGLAKPRREGLAHDELEHQEADSVCFLQSVDAADVRVIEGGEHPRLPLEARQAIRIARELLL